MAIMPSIATVRHRSVRTKGALSQRTVKLMVVTLVPAASKTWRRPIRPRCPKSGIAPGRADIINALGGLGTVTGGGNDEIVLGSGASGS